MRRLTLIIVLAAILAGLTGVGARRRSSQDVRRDRKRTEQRISQTRKRISDNQAETGRQLNRLTSLEARIALNNDTVDYLTVGLDSLRGAISTLDDSIAVLDSTTRRLKANYARTLREARTRRQNMSDLSFIFTAGSFMQAWRRYGYLQQLAKAGNRRARQINESAQQLVAARARLDTLRAQQTARIARLRATRRTLDGQRATAAGLVADLKRKGNSLNRELKKRRDEAAALDRELDKIIEREMREAEERRRREAEEAERRRREAEEAERRAAEARAAAAAAAAANNKKADKKASKATAGAPAAPQKPVATPAPAPKPTPAPTKPKPSDYTSEAAADRALSGSFAANKGRLLFPVAGRYSIVSNFGTNTHPELSKVKYDNLGIDVEVPAGTAARSVFEGVVSSIFRLEGYRNVVIVRHGEYLTVYGGLDNLSVRKGDKVRAGQNLGTIFIDTADEGRSRLHFEIRHEKRKLNPVEWVK